MDMQRICRSLFVALLLLGWMGALPAHGASATTVLFAARWDGGLSGWQPTGDSSWAVKSGVPFYSNPTGASELLAPYRLDGARDFAVEAEIARIGDRGRSLAHEEWGYGVFARGTGSTGRDIGGGFFFGLQNGGSSFYPQSGLDWGGSVLRGTDVALHDGFNTFRLEVHSDHYTLFENEVPTVQATVKGFRGDRVGIFSREYRIRVRNFRVTALPAKSIAGGPAPSLLSRLPALDLHSREAPGGFRKRFGEYYTNGEIAAGRGVTVDSLRQSGRLLSYQVEYGRLLDARHPKTGEKAIDATVAAFSTPAGARTDYDYLHGYYTGQQIRLATPGKYGVADFLATYEQDFRGVRYSAYDLGFVRGTYRVAVTVQVVKGTVPSFLALQWLDAAARAIDGRLKAAPAG